MLKRYTPDSSIHMSHEFSFMRETPEGGYVEYGDYATLFAELETVKAERDALAVENAALKGALTAKAYIDFIKSKGWNAGAKTINGKFAGFMDPEVDFGSMTFEHAKKLIDAVATPATDAALAAVRAQGVEQLIELKLKQLASMHPDTHAFGATAMSLRAQINELQAFHIKLLEAK
ncbi:hypothetical protein [Serratia proteamaculans]|uniref:hypothetical protein n=1 Tax=Serratia proteamaculans TaxID=28151 RepID=UPI00217781EB|nr:hypothetical protein [Serratia proteamaculans]CAI1761238.1 Uncharacterised protein [Serratia proteamaculans]